VYKGGQRQWLGLMEVVAEAEAEAEGGAGGDSGAHGSRLYF
jgi:hypothetical protein